MKLVSATANPHKYKEMKEILSGKIDLLPRPDEIPEIVEDASDLNGNALLKAQGIMKATGLPAIADDTGLEVDALDGAPGVYSARYAGKDPSYQDNVNKLLFELKGLKLEKRNARFRTVISYIDDNVELHSEGVIEGVITLESKGKEGFGYDPVFQPESYSCTFAEMNHDEKNLISHRARALEKMKKILEPYFDKGEYIG